MWKYITFAITALIGAYFFGGAITAHAQGAGLERFIDLVISAFYVALAAATLWEINNPKEEATKE